MSYRFFRFPNNHRSRSMRWTLSLLFPGLVALGATAARADDSVQVYTTTHFAIYWLTSGANAPVAGDADNNGRPDYVDTAAKDLEATYAMLADSLHYKKPRAQTTTIHTKRAVPSGLYPVEILDLATADSYWKGTGTYGCIHDSSESPDGNPGTQIWLENDFLDNGKDSIVVGIRGVIYHNWVKAPYTALKFAVAHELYHAFTYEYDDYWRYAFTEMSAVWFESWYAPETQNHWRYLPLFRDHLVAGAFSNNAQQGYGNFVILKAMVDLYGVHSIRKLWEDRAANDAGNDDAAWFKDAWKRLKLDTISHLTRYYGENAVKLITGQSSAFDDSGKLVGKIDPSTTPMRFWSVDTTPSSEWGTLAGPYAILPSTLSKSNLPAGLSLAFVTDSSAGGNLYVLRYPSRKMEIYDVSSTTRILSFGDQDTMLELINVTGEADNSWNFYGTSQASSLRPRSYNLPVYTRSTDVLGRPVSSQGPGMIRIDLTSDGDGARRRYGR
jgi:hypothetical protein